MLLSGLVFPGLCPDAGPLALLADCKARTSGVGLHEGVLITSSMHRVAGTQVLGAAVGSSEILLSYFRCQIQRVLNYDSTAQ